jgi:hypothetical protein
MEHIWWYTPGGFRTCLSSWIQRVEYFRSATQQQERRTCNTGILELNVDPLKQDYTYLYSVLSPRQCGVGFYLGSTSWTIDPNNSGSATVQIMVGWGWN